MLNQLLRPIARNLVRNGTRSSSSHVMEVKLSTVNDIPTTCGPWQDYYEKRQKVYNLQLIFGSLALLGTLAFIKMSGVIFFNFSPPQEPVEEKE